MSKDRDWWKRMNEAREALGWTHEELARRSGISPESLRKYASGAVEKPRGNALEKIAKALGRPPLWLSLGMFEDSRSVHHVPLKGYVGAGGQWHAVADGDYEMIDAPQGATENTVAGQVRGDSMLPLLPDGWLIFWSEKLPPDECLNTLCVCHLEDGRILVKTLTRGSKPGFYNLISLNATPLYDEAVGSASPIDWIKPRR